MVVQCSGVDTATAVIQAVAGTAASGTTASATLAANNNPANATVGFVGHEANSSATAIGTFTAFSAGAGFATPNGHIDGEWVASNNTTVSMTIASSAWVAIGLELKAIAQTIGTTESLTESDSVLVTRTCSVPSVCPSPSFTAPKTPGTDFTTVDSVTVIKTSGVTFTASPTVTLTESDSAVALANHFSAKIETLSESDSAAEAAFHALTKTETVSESDSLTSLGAHFAARTETLSESDVAAHAANTVPVVTLSESDSVAIHGTYGRLPTDSLTESDSVTRPANHFQNFTVVLSESDSASGGQPKLAAIIETDQDPNIFHTVDSVTIVTNALVPHFVTPTVTLSESDLAAEVAAHLRSPATETLTESDNAARFAAHVAAPSVTLSESDSAASFSQHFQVITQNLTTSSGVNVVPNTGGAQYIRNITETVVTVDVVCLDWKSSGVENLSEFDIVSVLKGHASLPIVTLSESDSITATVSAFRAVSDTKTESDTVARRATMSASPIVTLSEVDSANITKTTIGTVNAIASLVESDLPVIVVGRRMVLPETITESDAALTAIGRLKTVSEALTESDSVAIALGRQVFVAATLNINDSVSGVFNIATQHFARNATDNMALTDSVTGQTSLFQGAVEALTVVDSVTRQRSTFKSVVETFTVTSAVSIQGSATAAHYSVVPLVTLSETDFATSRLSFLQVGATESHSVSDSLTVTVTTSGTITLFESHTVLDQVNVVIGVQHHRRRSMLISLVKPVRNEETLYALQK